MAPMRTISSKGANVTPNVTPISHISPQQEGNDFTDASRLSHSRKWKIENEKWKMENIRFAISHISPTTGAQRFHGRASSLTPVN